ncbi:MAG: zinc-ribbon domain-containing protein [Schwartzia sp.]|nr:zinc-ribbon domain-containing protein [Schwartzia sp. (in: firmicutes)]
MSKFCTNCGEALTEGTRFCVKCGAEISADRQEINDVQQYEAVNREPEQDEKLGYEKDFEEYEDEKDFVYYVKKVLVFALLAAVMFESKYYHKHDHLYIPAVIQETFGIGSSADIEKVKNSSLREFPGVKIGKEMDRFFDDAKWSSEDMGKGGKRVTCSGTCIWEGRTSKAKISFIVVNNGILGYGAVTMNGVKLSPEDSQDVMRTIMRREYSL